MTSQMRAVDAAFLAMERPNEPSHVGSLLVFGPSEDGPLTVEAVRAALDERLPMMPSARRVIDGSFRSLRRPGWRRAERIDLDVHVRPHHLPGGVEARHALHDLVAQLHARPLRRDRPLWEIHVIDGLGEDTVAVFAKIHLAAMDDTTGVDLMTALLDTEEGPEPTMEEVSPRPDLGHDEDSALDRLVGPVPDQLRRSLGFPVRVAGRAAEALGEQLPGMTHTAAEMARRTPGLSRLAALVPQPEPGPGAVEHPTGRAPRLSYNEPIGPTRRFAAGSLPTGDLLRLKAVLGRSFHTAALVVCTGALRRWLSAKDELPSSPVVAIMPVLVDGGRSGDAHVGGMFVALPTNVADPFHRIELTADALAKAMAREADLPASLEQDIAMFAPSAVSTVAGRVLDALPHRRFVAPTINLAVTNVPGARRPVHLGGRPLRSSHPVLSVSDTTPLHLGVQAGPDAVGLGAVADGEHVADLVGLVDAAAQELTDLLELLDGGS